MHRSLSILFVVAAVGCHHAGASNAQDAGASAPAASTSAASTAKTACSIVGNYHARVNGAHGPATTAMAAGADGSLSLDITLDANHAVTTLKGTYTTSGDKVTMVNGNGSASNGRPIHACVGVQGVYSMSWSADCKQLTLHKVSDSCPDREREADGTTLTRD